MTEPGWEPAVPLGERLAWAVLLGGLPCLAAVGRLDLFSLIFASLWSALIVGGCAVGHRPRHERRGEVVTDSVMGSAATVSQQNARGQWVPAIPEPMFVGWRLRRCRCNCRETFKDRATYRGHYALVHILAVPR